MINNFPCIPVLDDLNSFFNNSIEWLDNFNNSLHYLLLHDFHLNNFSNDPLNWNNLLFYYLHFSEFRNSVINNLLDWVGFLDLHDSLDYHLHFYDFGNFNDSFHNFFDDSWNLDYFLRKVGNFDYFFNDVIDILDDFNRNMDYFLHLLNLNNLN